MQELHSHLTRQDLNIHPDASKLSKADSGPEGVLVHNHVGLGIQLRCARKDPLERGLRVVALLLQDRPTPATPRQAPDTCLLVLQGMEREGNIRFR